MHSRSARIGSQTIASLQPDELIWDTALPRFGARRRRASTTYLIKVRIGGRQRWITLGRHGPLTPAEARAKARHMLAQIDSGQDPTREREQRRTMPTVAEFAEQWLTEHVTLKRKPTTATEYRRIVRRHIEPTLGKLPIDDVALNDALRLHTSLASQPYLGNRVIAALSAIMTYAERYKLRPPASNPCRGLERFKERKRKRPLTQSERSRLWAHLDDLETSENPFIVAALRLLLLTGMRKNEVLRMRWADVDLKECLINLNDAKTGARTVVLSRMAVAVLSALPRQADNPYVICGHRDGKHLVNLHKTWNAIRHRLGFSDVRIHDLRHTVGTMLARTAPLVVVRDALGHQVIQTTSGYSHTAQDAVRAALDGLAIEFGDHA